MTKTKLYACLNAVNDYEWPVSALAGCVNDGEAWKAYLESLDGAFEVVVDFRKNVDATKSGILNGFIEVLEQATENDVVFFYFSGHGTREKSHEVFKEIDSDGAFEALVCYDGITHDGELFQYNLISDKEIHYTLSKHAKPGTHVVLVFDSCHSGNITRNAIQVEGEVNTRKFIPPRDAIARLSVTAPMRPWSQFAFGAEVDEADITSQGWFDLFPQRAHVALSACLNDESAYEIDGHGIFTTNMIDVLNRTGGVISYRGLQGRIRQFVRNQMNQTPEIFAPNDFDEILLGNFLNRVGESPKFMALCTYSVDDGWVMNMGSSQGVRDNSGPVSIQVDETRYDANILEVRPTSTVLEVPNECLAILDEKTGYNCNIQNYLAGNTAFYLDGAGEVYKEIASFFGDRETSNPFTLTSIKTEANYIITANDEFVEIVNNTSWGTPVWNTRSNSHAIAKLYDAVCQISRYEFVKTYDNPEVDPNTPKPVSVYAELILPSGETEALNLEHDRIELKFKPGLKLRLRMDNEGSAKYFCALLYMSNTFGVTGGLVDGKVKLVQSGTQEWILNGRPIPVTLEEHVIEMNAPYSLSYLKLLANKEAFHVDEMEMTDLPAPTKKVYMGVESATRGLAIEEPVKEVTWFTRTIELKINNPNFSEGES